MLKSINFLSSIVTSKPKMVLVLLLAFLGIMSLFINEFKMDASSDSLVLENDEDFKYYREITNNYASSDFLVVIFTPNSELFDRKTINKVKEIVSDFESVKGVNSVLSYLDAPLLFSPKMGMRELANNLRTIEDEEVDLSLAKEEFKGSPLYSELLVSKDSTSTAIQLTLEFDSEYNNLIKERDKLKDLLDDPSISRDIKGSTSNDLQIVNSKINQINTEESIKRDDLISQVRTVMKQHSDEGTLYLGGTAMIASDMMSYVQSDLNTFGLGVFILFLISLSIVFRSIRWVALPLFCSAGITFLVIGLLGFLDWRVTVVSSNFVALLLIISISLSIHLIVRYQEVASRGTLSGQKEIVGQTYREMFVPCLYTALTTIVAFASLSISEIKPVIDFGRMMALGITIAFIFIFTALPSLMSILEVKPSDSKKDFKHSATLRFSSLTAKFGNQILILSATLLLVAVFGINKLTVENRFIDYFKDTTEIYIGMELLDKKLGGTAPLDLIINSPKETNINSEEDPFDEFEDDFGDDEESNGYWWNTINIKKIEEIHDYLEDKKEIGKVLSIASGIKVAEELKDGSELSEFDLALIKNLLPEDIKETLLSAYISEDENQVRISSRVLETSRGLNRNELLSSIEKDLKDKFNLEEDQFRLTGLAVLYNNMLQSLFTSQIKTIGIVFGIIFIMFIFLFRSFI
ncbi:MAG: membrane protein [Gammaproteobacteria bacterium]|nr:MAG: membrane protein [Gammaproteobacteria bacterium]